MPDDGEDYTAIAREFFAHLAECAEGSGTVIALEANPPIYGTNFINTTAAAFDFVKAVNKEGLKVNLDIGTMICNNEDLALVAAEPGLVNHIHLSEPHLAPLMQREIHTELKGLPYERYLSIEMKAQDSLAPIKAAVEYIGGLF
jgi:sugar phosphate isomerase/epimerase